ncbi:CheA signal transduction histidine kinase [Stanieria cyanosphaera PCC 7437]|uniref:histidine kinase n=1 Tax=Stanieria cyanosphaera (strain ATCC 29371 / PCC 7437) TaxID=111780 RepID=K9XRA6_STAC7|nr:hybrid sensor histidine kinase/response regulator [Stanieria cyanosphaera]AFZ34614.1 CheA signal transduction histidine kinase [Stanieria cyanosphaera PCC 7437]
MKIEDDELRELYKASSTERIGKLEQGLLHLEQNPQDQVKLEELLREAHTLKGDSRMLGLNEIEMLIHQLEDCLAAIKRGEETFNPQTCDRYYQALDAISQLVHQAITGEEANVNTFQVLAALMGAEVELASQTVSSPADDLFADSTPTTLDSNKLSKDDLLGDFASTVTPTNPNLIPESKTSNVKPASDQIIDTIRVEPEKLDALMAQAGELTVAKQRINNQVNHIQQISDICSELNQNKLNYRLLFRKIEQSLSAEYLKSFHDFLAHTQTSLEQLETLVDQLQERSEEDSTNLDLVSNRLEKGIRNLRLLPLSNVFNLFHRLVRDLGKDQKKQIQLSIEGGNTLVDKRILEELKDPLLHIIRNAIDHGIETPSERQSKGKPATATIQLRGYQIGSSVIVEIKDDGRGLDLEQIKQTALRKGIHTEAELAQMSREQIQALIFASGFSTRTKITDISGRGVGLDVVRANVDKLKGSIEVTSTPNQGCQFSLRLSSAIATTKALILKVNQNSYALPIEFVTKILLLSQQDIFTLTGDRTIVIDECPVPVAWLADILELPLNIPAFATVNNISHKNIPCIIVRSGKELIGILIEEILTQQEIILKPQSKLIQRVRNFAGATILDHGEVCMVLNAQDLAHSISKGSQINTTQLLESIQIKPSLLLVEDSIVIRTQMKRILESAGYQVTTAVDGLDGFNKLRKGKFDGIISDVEMPNLDGLSLTERIRQYPEYRELPIILVTTLAKDEDKRRGAQAGANAYLTKGDFDQTLLLDTLNRLV